MIRGLKRMTLDESKMKGMLMDCGNRSDGGEDDMIVARKIDGREQDDDDEVMGVVARECGDQTDGGRDEDVGRDNEISVGAGIGNVDKGSGEVIEMEQQETAKM